MSSINKVTTWLGRPFAGGVHPEDYKSLTDQETGRVEYFQPNRLYLPLLLSSGILLKPVVKVGQEVVRGQLLAEGVSRSQPPLHSPVNGIVEEIAPHIAHHPSKVKVNTIQVRCFKEQSWSSDYQPRSMVGLSAEAITQYIEQAGIIGLGGAGFPTAMKAHFAKQAKVDTLIINGGECEPYITCDDRVMRAHSNEVIAGIRLLLVATGAQKAIVGIENNKQASYQTMLAAASEDDNITVELVPTLYPMGSARHMIKTLTGKTVPSGKRSTDIGVVVNNISTARAVYHAVRFARPLISKVITVSGQGIESPCNLEVPIGTRVKDIIAHCGGLSIECERLIFGGPMMGQVITDLDIPITKTINGLLALTSAEIGSDQQQECIRCGQCVRACPMGLMPFKMRSASEASEYELVESLGIKHCLSCGACSYICPSRIPLVQYFQHAKGVITQRKMSSIRQERAKKLAAQRTIRLTKEAELKKAAKAAKKKRGKRNTRTEVDVEANV
ncbi:electron transport complex subunit RsxC [Vibrio sp. FNV 38]|nr:electron transport complex subunit RsxC [Vibrio sp. FNV 38]